MATKKATTAAKKSATAPKTAVKKAAAVKTAAKKVAAKKAVAKKAPARKAVAKKATTTAKKAAPTHEEIAKLAHHYFSQRGYEHGSHDDDWARAEKELS
jgi:hypothetical protein